MNFLTVDNSSHLKVGDWVEVRSKEEILRTLDKDGRLEGMPFMPEMFSFCGGRFQVYKRAHKTCDTVFPVRGRRVDHAVHLETRCDGSAHGGCQATCLLFWKDAWLKPLANSTSGQMISSDAAKQNSNSGCSEAVLVERSQWIDPDSHERIYSCQATQLPYATGHLEWWDIRQYVEDVVSGNIRLWQLFCGLAYFIYYNLSIAGIGLGRAMRWFYDHCYPLWGGAPFPRRHGSIPRGKSTPAAELGLQPGELVRIKPYREILATLDTRDRNRGLYFDAEEVPYCGGNYRVLKRVTRIVNEKTGRMLEFKTPCLILEDVICRSRYSECRLACPRSIYSYWREVWLERVESQSLLGSVEIEDKCETVSST